MKNLWSRICLLLVSTTLIASVTFPNYETAYAQFFDDSEKNNHDINSTDSRSNVTPTGSESEGSNVGEIVLLSEKFKDEDRFGLGRIVGQVKNIGNDSATSISIEATVYDKNGDVITSKNSYTKADTLLPNQKSSFEILAYAEDFKEMESYDLSLRWVNSTGSEVYVDNAQIYKANTANASD